ncbi:MAG: hypothetical protein KC416_13720, partial [Myxococcales bacterium]|nr:hypothetical protein [Myxococcales bacterium]
LDARIQVADNDHQVLTRWGQAGRESARMVWVALTDTPPFRGDGAYLVILTDRGAYLRGVGTHTRTRLGALPPADLISELGEILHHLEGTPEQHAAAPPLFLSAESGIPLEQIARTLQDLTPLAPRGITLVVPLPEGTRMPAPFEARVDPQGGRCPDGLPDTEEAYGELTATALQNAAGPFLTEGASACLAGIQGPDGAGGRMTVALRIDPAGTVKHACVTASDFSDGRIEACVLGAVLRSRFPQPTPEGIVDVALPVRLVPTHSPLQPLCGR